MSKVNKSKKPNTRGKGRLTPIQVAFIVERYLEDHNYSTALAAFRSEAADIFSKIKGKKVPKGLLGLEDILNEYIEMKGEKILVNQEKRRIENAFQGLQEVMKNYISHPLQPNLGVNPSFETPSQGQMVCGSFISPTQPFVPTNSDCRIRSSITLPNCSSGEKRKSSISASDPPAVKKHNLTSTKKSHARNVILSVNTSSMQANIAKTVIQASSTHTKSSPETPTTENPSLNAIISSETIVISPIKGQEYYSVERSYQVSTSPLKKLSPWKMNNRERIKGRLDFDKSIDPQSSTDNADFQSSPSKNNFAEASADFEFELPDFSLFDGELSRLLGDIDVNSQQPQVVVQPSASEDHLTSSVQNVNDGCLEINPGLPNDSTSTGTIEPTLQKDLNVQNCDALTTKRSTTKRIMISSPCKAGKIKLKQIQSPEKF